MAKPKSENPKSEQIRVRLGPSAEGQAAQIALTAGEKQAVRDAAIEMGYPSRWGISSFVRDCGVRASEAYYLPTDGESIIPMFERASADAGLKVGPWLRLIVLEVIGLYSAHKEALDRQTAAAKEAYRNKTLRLNGDDVEEE